jgi:Fur family ferric uptake transcriptional regulator
VNSKWYRALHGATDPDADAGRSDAIRCSSNVDGLHHGEKEEFFRLLKQSGETLSPGGEDLLDFFLQKEGHLSVDYVKKELEARGQRTDGITVEAVLEQFCRYGIAQKTRLNGDALLYEHLHLGAHHDHFLCTRCGRVEEFFEPQLEAWQDEVARRHGFQPLRHRLVIYGLCIRCTEHWEPALPLSMAACGERVKIISFLGGRRIQGRLVAMGLVCGDIVEVLNNAGPFIVNAKGARLALGEGLAQKVLVSLVRQTRGCISHALETGMGPS